MLIGLIGLLKRGVPSSFLKKLWCPPLLSQGSQHRMAKDMRGNGNASAGSEPPKKRSDICIREGLASSRALPFDEQMIRFYLGGMYNPHVGHDLVDEIC